MFFNFGLSRTDVELSKVIQIMTYGVSMDS